MTILEKIFSRTIMQPELSFLNYGSKLLYLHLGKNKYTGEEYYPIHCKFKVYHYKDIYIGVLKIKYKVYNLDKNVYNTYTKTVEVRMDGVNKNYQTIGNMLLKKISKELLKEYKSKGYRECLVDYLYIIESDYGIHKLELDTVFKKFNKFMSIRILILD